MLCAILAAATLDIFVDRPLQRGGSITTLLPGVAYASATVMKVCLASGLVSAIVALVSSVSARFLGRRPGSAAREKRSNPASKLGDEEHSGNASNPSRQVLPVWGIVSVALTPLTPLVAAFAVVIAQTLVDSTESVSASDFPQIARTGVLVMLALISAAALAAVLSAVRRERPGMLSMLGLVINALLIGLFWHLKFYALGFDQDTWAPR